MTQTIESWGVVIAIQTGHSSGAALFDGGKLARVLAEEKFTDVKCQGGFPVHCLRALRAEYGVADRVVVCGRVQFRNSAEPDVVSRVAAGGARCAVDWTQYHLGLPRLPFWALMQGVYRARTAMLRPELLRLIKAETGVGDAGVEFMDHHTLHALSPIVFYNLASDPEPILSITMDGHGDDSSGKIFVVECGVPRLLADTRAEDSVPCLYGEVTNFLGMRALYHEYKVMGLAGYVSDADCEHLMPLFRGLARVEGLQVVARKDLLLSRYWLRQNLVGKRFDHVAGAIQRFLEEIAVQLVRNAVAATGIRRVALSGGAFMNCKLNQKIAGLKEVEKLWVMPGCGDESLPVGAVTGYSHGYLYGGVAFSEGEILMALQQRSGIQARSHGDAEGEVARLLTQGVVVARACGRSEWGPRALGNRSILANPSMPACAARLNDQIKCRDFWMPFSPTILAEAAPDYIRDWARLERVCGESMQHMTITADTTAVAQRDIPGAMHAKDKTIRPQVLRRECNPHYHNLIKRFSELTTIPAVLNTSLNVHGKPLAATLTQVLDTFQNSGLTHMQLENLILTKACSDSKWKPSRSA